MLYKGVLKAHEYYFIFWVIFLFDLEVLNYFLLLLGILVFLRKGYVEIHVLLGVVVVIANKRVFMLSIKDKYKEIEFNKF